VNSGGSFGGNPFRKEIGIGKATIIDEMKITWPASGIVQVFKDVAPRQFLTIEEGKDQLEKQDIKKLVFKSQPGMGGMDMMKMLDCAPTTTSGK
jgi:ASPIC and UnbV